MNSASKMTPPSDREFWGLACLLIGRDTDHFENGCREPWRDVGQSVRNAPLASRLATLREMLAPIPGLEIESFMLRVNEFDPTGPPPEEDADGDPSVGTLPMPADFPVDALPNALRDYVVEGSRSLACPPDYIAVPLLVAAGVAFGTTVRLQIKGGWYELPSLYTAVVAPSGSKKSPALDLAIEFTRAKGHEYLLGHQTDLKNFERLEAEYQSQRDARQKPRSAADRASASDKPIRPILSRTWVDDSTLEALAQKLQENPRGLAIIRDELAGLLLSFNQYRNGRGADPQFLLSTWSSQPTAIDRKKDPNPIILHRPLLGIAGTIQPAVLVKVFGGDRLHDGFAARFLFSDPLVLPYRSSEAVISDPTRGRVHDLIEALYRISHSNPFSDPPEPHLVRLSPAARRVFVEFEEWIGSQLGLLSSDDPYMAPLSKLPGCLGRIALILHICHRVGTDLYGFEPMQAETMRAAVQITRYFESHARRVWRRLSESAEDSQMRKAHNWIVRKGRPVTAREMNQHGVAGLKDSREANYLIQRMVDCGLVDPVVIGQTTRYVARSMTVSEKHRV